MGKVASLVLLAVMGVGLGAPAVGGQANVETRDVSVRYLPPEEVSVAPVVDELAPETVLTIEARGFEGGVTGEVRQCLVGAPSRCLNRLPVRFDTAGSAERNDFFPQRDHVVRQSIGLQRW